VDLVVDQVEQLQDVHVADRDLALVGLAAAAVEQLGGARGAAAGTLALVDAEVDAPVGVLVLPADQRLVDVLDCGAVEDRGRDIDTPAV
jgi:hypothetical protein